tara:strand:- start:6637 stop:6810 length:174 start_codon:yes stop_codon:yes gene_type:complete
MSEKLFNEWMDKCPCELKRLAPYCDHTGSVIYAFYFQNGKTKPVYKSKNSRHAIGLQ